MMASHSVVLVLVHQRMILEKNFRLGKSACITLAARDKGFNVDSNVHLSASVITRNTAETLVGTIADTPKGTIAVFFVLRTYFTLRIQAEIETVNTCTSGCYSGCSARGVTEQ